MSLKVTARWVVGHLDGDHTLYQNGEIALDGARLAYVGPRRESGGADVVDFGNAVITPGFVDLNALADADTTILGVGHRPPAGAKAWSEAYTGRARDVLTRTEQLGATRAALCQGLLSGITTALPVTSLLFRRWAETAEDYEEVAALAGEIGIRLVLGPTFRSSVNYLSESGAVEQRHDEAAGLAGLQDAVSFIRRMDGAESVLVTGLLVPSTIETCSDALIQATAKAAAELGVPFRLHCCQSKTEAELIWRRSGRSPLGHLQALGVLSRQALLPHALDLGGPQEDPALIEADLAALASSGAVVVNCPLVSGRGGRRLESFASFRDRGIRIGVGTDTAPPNMLMNLQTGLWLARMGAAGSVTPADYFRAATLGGADAIGRPDLGRLQAGSAADFVVWDLSALDMQPVHDPVEALFLMPPGLRPRGVWIAGRQVVRDGHIVGIDEAAQADALQDVFEKLRASFTERHPRNTPWPELFRPTFPVRGASITE